MDADLRKQWEAKEEFPPYEFALEQGKEMFATPFKNGKSYADCFPNQGIGIRQNYPYFDEKAGKVITLELALNLCREANGESPYSYVKDEMAALTAYMAYTSRGKPFDIKIPNDPRALEAYENGKKYFYQRRGQLNFSCASCHVQSPGQRIRTEVLAPGARHPRRDADLPLGVGRHGHDQPSLRHLQQPGSRRPARAAGRPVPRRRILPLLHEQRPADRGPRRAPVRSENAMRKYVLIPLAIVWSLAGIAFVAAAGSEADFKSALAAAESREQGSGRAQESMDDDRDSSWRRPRRRRRPETSTRPSVSPSRPRRSPKRRSAQAKEQQEAWRAVEIR